MQKISIIICLFVVMAFNSPEKKRIKLWLIGDSTMSIKEKKAGPETGGGMPFASFWDSTVTVDNRAKNGRSTKSFMTEELWKSVTDELAEGDGIKIAAWLKRPENFAVSLPQSVRAGHRDELWETVSKELDARLSDKRYADRQVTSLGIHCSSRRRR